MKESETFQQFVLGYQVTQAIAVAARLGIADLLAEGPKRSDDLAQATDTHAPSMYRLLRALASVGVFTEIAPGEFDSTPLSRFLRSDSPDSLRGYALMHAEPVLWRGWDLFHSVRTGEPGFEHVYGMPFFEYLSRNPPVRAVFDAGMNARARHHAVAETYDFDAVDTLVDVGGGQGALLAAVLRAHPRLQGILFDLPHVIAQADALLGDAAGRWQVAGGDFFIDVPAGGDAYALSWVVHDWGDDESVEILRNCRRAMSPDGRLLLIERVLPSANAPAPSKFGDLNMLVLTAGGRERTEAEFRSLLDRAGFTLSRILPTSTEVSIIEAIPQ